MMIFDPKDAIANLEQMYADCELNNEHIGLARGNWQDEMDALRLAIDELTAEREAREKAEEERDGLKSMIASTPNGCKVIDAAMARIEVLKEDKNTVSLAAYKAVHDAMCRFEQRTEFAEQRNREAMEQEPVLFAAFHKSNKTYATSRKKAEAELFVLQNGLSECDCEIVALYPSPIPPADVAELQHELAEQRENFKDLRNVLESTQRKLAEQQAGGKIAAWRVGSLAYTKYQTAVATAQANMLPIEELVLRGGNELTVLLEEARKQAVPEGWKLVPIEPTDDMAMASLTNCKDASRWITERKRVYRDMLSAAPQPDAAIRAKGN